MGDRIQMPDKRPIEDAQTGSDKNYDKSIISHNVK